MEQRLTQQITQIRSEIGLMMEAQRANTRARSHNAQVVKDGTGQWVPLMKENIGGVAHLKEVFPRFPIELKAAFHLTAAQIREMKEFYHDKMGIDDDDNSLDSQRQKFLSWATQ